MTLLLLVTFLGLITQIFVTFLGWSIKLLDAFFSKEVVLLLFHCTSTFSCCFLSSGMGRQKNNIKITTSGLGLSCHSIWL